MREATDYEWRQFCRLGERIGDGDLDEDEKWIRKEYKRLSRICCPGIKEVEKEMRQERNKQINEQMKEFLKVNFCPLCEYQLKQTRSGSKTVICLECGKRFKIKRRRNKK